MKYTNFKKNNLNSKKIFFHIENDQKHVKNVIFSIFYVKILIL